MTDHLPSPPRCFGFCPKGDDSHACGDGQRRAAPSSPGPRGRRAGRPHWARWAAFLVSRWAAFNISLLLTEEISQAQQVCRAINRDIQGALGCGRSFWGTAETDRRSPYAIRGFILVRGALKKDWISDPREGICLCGDTHICRDCSDFTASGEAAKSKTFPK